MTVLEHVQDLWTTPFLQRQVAVREGYNDDLAGIIRQRRRAATASTIGMVDGDKSPADMLRWDEPEVRQLTRWIVDAADEMNTWTGAGSRDDGHPVEMVAEAWAVTYEEHGHHALHSHPDSAWSGVYYVTTGRPGSEPGAVEFLDPRSAAIARHPNQAAVRRVIPRPGLLIAFPSWLKHWVTPHGSPEERICVAFNVGFAR